MRKVYKKKKFRNGFTLIELIISVSVIAVLAALLYPNIMDNKNKSVISSTVLNDVKLIAGAVAQWKANSSDSDGSCTNLTTQKLSAYLPASMKYDAVNDAVTSSGLNDGIAYQVISDKITTNGDSFKIYMDFTTAISRNKYNDRIIQYAENSAMDNFKKISSDSATAEKASDATALGTANDDLTRGGTDTDGLCGVRKIAY